MNAPFHWRRSALALSLCASVLLAACGGGGGGGGDGDAPGADNNGGGENESPTAKIVFPRGTGISTNGTLVVRGTANDDGAVSSLTVNGVAATTDDGYANWVVEVPLEDGENKLVVEVVDDESKTSSSADSVTVTHRPAPLTGPTGVAYDRANNRALVLDSTQRALFGIDLASGERSVVSSAAKGTGPTWRTGLNVDTNAGASKAYVLDYASQALIEIDTSTGNRTIVSSPARGNGPFPGTVRDIAVHPDGTRTFTVEALGWEEFRIYEIDHASGDRRLVSSESVGSGSLIGFPLGIDWDDIYQRLVVTSADPYLVFVDPLSGARSQLTLSDATVWTYDLEVFSDVAYVTDSNSSFGGGQIFAVNLNTGATEPVTGVAGSGDDIIWANAVGYDFTAGRLLVADITGSAIVSVDTNTLVRERLTSNDDLRIGEGPRFVATTNVEIDSGAREAYVIDSESGQLLAIDLDTGNREIRGETAFSFDATVLDAGNGRLIGLDGATVTAVDVASGESEWLGDISYGPSYVNTIALDSAGNRIFYSSGTSLFSLSLDTLTLDMLANTQPAPVAFTYFAKMVFDKKRDRLLVADKDVTDSLKSITLSTGERQLLIPAGADSPTFLSEMKIDEAEDNVFVMDAVNGAVRRINLDTLQQETLAGGGNQRIGAALGLGVDEDSGLAWTRVGGAIVEIDLVGGSHLVISY